MHSITYFFYIIMFYFFNSVYGNSGRPNISEEVINNIISRHDSRIPPPGLDNFIPVESRTVITWATSIQYISGNPVTSRVQIFIQSLDSVDEYSMDFSLSFILRQRWYDERLVFNAGNISRLELDITTMKMIWTPDIYILNEKKADLHRVTMPNKLMHIYSNGVVVYNMRISGKYACDMNLQKYPHDEQICQLVMESFGYSAETLVLRWQDIPAERTSSMQLPQFDIDKLSDTVCDQDHANVRYTCIALSIGLRRNYGFYAIQIYVPSVLIVSLSWLSFWLSIDAIPARISLGLLTVLTMTTQSSSARASLPRVSYIKALDVWVMFCLMFVYMALIEFAYVNVLARVKNKQPNGGHFSEERNSQNQENGNPARPGRTERKRAQLVDRISRILFPSVFIFFNMVYWIVYTT